MVVTYFGEHAYLINKKVNARLEKVSSFNKTILNKPRLEEAGRAVNRSPNKGTYRIVVIRSLSYLEDKGLIGLLENKPELTIVIFQLGASPFVGHNKLKQWLLEYAKQYEKIKAFTLSQASEYVENYARRESIKIEDGALHYLLFLVGHKSAEDIDSALAELEKEISTESISKSVTRKTEIDLFPLITKFLQGDISAYNSIVRWVQENENKRLLSVSYRIRSVFYLGLLSKENPKLSSLSNYVNSYAYHQAKKMVGSLSTEDLASLYLDISKITCDYKLQNKTIGLIKLFDVFSKLIEIKGVK